MHKFKDLYDFESAFLQNIAGNTISIVDMVTITSQAFIDEDYKLIVYQLGRFLRRAFDYDPMKSAAIEEISDVDSTSNEY